MDAIPEPQELDSPIQAIPPAAETPSSFHASFLRRVFREDRFFLILSVFIGVFSGLSVVCFRYAIDLCRMYFLGSEITAPALRLMLVPSLTGLVIAVLVLHVFPLARGSGVNQTKAALYIYNGYIPFRTAIGKFITAALAIGSGQSITQASQQAKGLTTDYALVHTTTAGWNLVKVAQLASWVAEGKSELTLQSMLPLRSLPYLHPDHPLEVALRYVDRWPIVPVVNRANFSQLEGVVSKQDVLARYQELDETD